MEVTLDQIQKQLSEISRQIQEVREQVQESHCALFGGKINPGLVTRIERLEMLVYGEDGKPGLSEQMRDLQVSIQSLSRLGWVIVSAIIGAAVVELARLAF